MQHISPNQNQMLYYRYQVPLLQGDGNPLEYINLYLTCISAILRGRDIVAPVIPWRFWLGEDQDPSPRVTLRGFTAQAVTRLVKLNAVKKSGLNHWDPIVLQDLDFFAYRNFSLLSTPSDNHGGSQLNCYMSLPLGTTLLTFLTDTFNGYNAEWVYLRTTKPFLY